MERGDETRKGRKRRDAGSRPGPSARGSSSNCGDAAGAGSGGRAQPGGDDPRDAPLQTPLEEASAEPSGTGPSFEDEFAATEKAVEALERGDLSLEESLRAYEDGLRALKTCYDVLQRAQRRIEVLGQEIGAVTEDSDAPFWKPATSTPSLDEVMGRVDREGELPPATPSPGGPASSQGRDPEDSEDQ